MCAFRGYKMKIIENSNASKSVRYLKHVDLSDVDCFLISGWKCRPGRNVWSIWQIKRKVSLCIMATNYDRLEIDGNGGGDVVGCGIWRFKNNLVYLARLGRTKRRENRRVNGICIFFPTQNAARILSAIFTDGPLISSFPVAGRRRVRQN